MDLSSLRAASPDGLYVLPPDAARAGEVGERAAEVLLVAWIAAAVGILVLITAIAASVS